MQGNRWNSEFGLINSQHVVRRKATAAGTTTVAPSRCGRREAASGEGIEHGETDDYCYSIAQDPVPINDLNATILHCLGIDHERLRYKSSSASPAWKEPRVVQRLLA